MPADIEDYFHWTPTTMSETLQQLSEMHRIMADITGDQAPPLVEAVDVHDLGVYEE